MGCEIISDTLDLELETLEPILPDPSVPETIGPGYPFPMLRRSGQIRQVSLRTITLRNSFVEAVFCVDLGGRMISLRNLLDGTEALTKGLTLVADPLRGVAAIGGFELLLDGTRAGAMAAVDFTTTDEDGAELVMAELVHGRCLSWGLRAEVLPDSTGLNLTLTLQNRGDKTTTVEVGWRWDGQVGLTAPRSSAILLAPHEVFTTKLAVHPLGFPPVATSPLGAIGLQGRTAHLQCFVEAPNSKLVVKTEKGTLEAPVVLRINKPDSVNLDSIPGEVAGLALMSDGEVLVQWPIAIPKQYEQHAGTRHFAHWQYALDALQANDYTMADHHLETSLLYNGDDPMAWWLKAVVQRHLGVAEERPELLNAHFLSPLDPALRVESFLSQSEHSKNPSPLMAPLARDPDAVIEVLCLLIGCHLIEDATRLCDEVLRHREIPMVRYLMAYLHITYTGMELEAANHIQAAEAGPIAPPFPWRRVEQRALHSLLPRFADSKNLALLARLCH